MLLNIIIGLYGGLSIISGVLQGWVKNIVWWSAIILTLGGSILISVLFLEGMLSVYLLILGGLLIQWSALINNYKMHGKINKTHHFSRMIGTVLLIVSQWMSIQ